MFLSHEIMAKWEIAYGEDPLQSKGNTPCPFILTLVVAICSSSDDDRADGPGHLERGRASTSQGEWDNLTGVGRGIGNEKAPWHTFQSLTDDQKSKRVSLDEKLAG